MQLTRLAKNATSFSGNCEAIYETDDPTKFVVQGKVLSAADAENMLDVDTDEAGVTIPIETVLRFVREWNRRHPGLGDVLVTVADQQIAGGTPL